MYNYIYLNRQGIFYIMLYGHGIPLMFQLVNSWYKMYVVLRDDQMIWTISKLYVILSPGA